MLKSPTWKLKTMQCIFCNCLLMEPLFLKLFPQTWHLQLSLCEYSYRHLRHCNVKSVKSISRRNKNHETIANKKIASLRFQHFRPLLQNPKLKLMASFFFNNHSMDLYSPKSLDPWLIWHFTIANGRMRRFNTFQIKKRQKQE